MDTGLYDKCSREHADKTKARDNEREAAAQRWQQYIADAATKGFDVSSL